MKTTISILLFALAASIPTFGAETSVGEALETKMEKGKIIATLKAGFHFNEKAPNHAMIDDKKVEPLVLSRQKITFQLPKSFTIARATIFVCDDANTFCEPKTIEFRGGAAAVAYMTARAEMKRAQPKDIARKRPKINRFGFIEDDLDHAAEVARKSKSLILADFSARWCPGCIRLENEILNTRDFKKSSVGFIKVKLDYDRFENLQYKSKFGIFGIPTLLVLTPDLEEVTRVVDYQPMQVLEEFLKEAKLNPVSLSELKTKADTGDSAANLILAKRLYAANRFEESLTYFAKVTPEPLEYLDAKVNAAKKASTESAAKKAQFIATVKEAVKAEPLSSRSIVWRTGLVEALSTPADKKAVAEEGVKVADSILANPAKIKEAVRGDFIGEYAGYEQLLVAVERADLIEASGAPESEVRAAREKVTAIGTELKIPVSRKGPSLRLLIAMGEAKQFQLAEIQARKLLKKDPKNPELHRRLLRTLNGQEKYPEAVTVGRKAISKSYGKNEIWVAVQLAKAYAGNKQALEARALARSYLERPDIDWQAMPNEQKDLQALVQSQL